MILVEEIHNWFKVFTTLTSSYLYVLVSLYGEFGINVGMISWKDWYADNAALILDVESKLQEIVDTIMTKIEKLHFLECKESIFMVISKMKESLNYSLIIIRNAVK